MEALKLDLRVDPDLSPKGKGLLSPSAPPPPVPPVPPSRGRILSLKKCYRKAKSAFKKGSGDKSANGSGDSVSVNTNATGIHSDSSSSCGGTSDEHKTDSLRNPDASSSCHISSDFPDYANATSINSTSSNSGYYENMEFSSGNETDFTDNQTNNTVLSNVKEEELYDEDDDSSKWTISTVSQTNTHSNSDREVFPEVAEVVPEVPEVFPEVPKVVPEVPVVPKVPKILDPDLLPIPELKSPKPKIPEKPLKEPGVIKDPDLFPLPVLKNLKPKVPVPVPSFPSSSSSDDSFASCASDPEKLKDLKDPQRSPTSLNLSACYWERSRLPRGARGQGPLSPGAGEDEDEKTEAGTADLESEEEDPEQGQDLAEAIAQSVTFTLPWDTERPETGPGEEGLYQNVTVKMVPVGERGDSRDPDSAKREEIMELGSPESPEEGIVHAVINLPPRVMQVVKERRLSRSVEERTHGRSSRLSKLMQTDLSLSKALDQKQKRVSRVSKPFNMNVKGWVRKREDSFEKGMGESEEKQGANEFEELRRFVKQGGDFCKDLASVLHERAELESQYAKGLSKLSAKLLKASKEAKGTVAHAWQAVAVQIDTQAELHRQWSSSLEDELAKPLKTSTDTQHKIRKSVEVLVDKTTRNLADWRLAEAKAKRHCFSSAKEFEKLQDPLSPNSPPGDGGIKGERPRSRLTSTPSVINYDHGNVNTSSSYKDKEKDPIKLESKRRKAEEAVRRGDVDYYTFCIRSERARLEWEGAIRNGSSCLRTLEEEKLSLLSELAEKYLLHLAEFGPRLQLSAESLEEPVKKASVEADLHAVSDIRRHIGAEQLLPDFYAEDNSNLMSRNRRKEALEKCLYLITQDLERERKGAIGVENLAKAVSEGPKLDTSHHDISEKLYYLRSMLLYLEASRVKVDNALKDTDSRGRENHPITQYVRHQRDKQGLPQTILKVPSWAREECLSLIAPLTEWTPDRQLQLPERDRGKADGTSAPDAEKNEAGNKKNGGSLDLDSPSIGKCRAIYDYDANLFDELTIRVGQEINIHDKQEDGWWLGELKGQVGIFPATYVEEIIT